MAHPLEAALAAEVRAEIARQGLSRNVVAEAAGINARSWSRYFAKGADRPIPLAALFGIADVLRVPAADLMARAEARAETSDDPVFEAMSDEAQAAISPLRDKKPTDPSG